MSEGGQDRGDTCVTAGTTAFTVTLCLSLRSLSAVTTHLQVPYPLWSAERAWQQEDPAQADASQYATTAVAPRMFDLRITARVPSQAIRIRPGVSEELKHGWIQYVAFLFVSIPLGEWLCWVGRAEGAQRGQRGLKQAVGANAVASAPALAAPVSLTTPAPFLALPLPFLPLSPLSSLQPGQCASSFSPMALWRQTSSWTLPQPSCTCTEVAGGREGSKGNV